MSVPIGAPAGFATDTHRHTALVPHAREDVWAWLVDPATFVEPQVWPWRVEFVGGGFEEGVRTAHHGPLMLFAGVLGEVRAPEYRDLQYCYGSFAVAFRLIRPTRLQFWLDEQGASTRVTLQVDAFVRPWVRPAWTAVQRVFWGRFDTWMERAVAARRASGG